MKATGIVRRIDDLGRVVIPKEIRRTLRIREGDPLEIYTEKDGEVIFKKYSPVGELSGFAGEICDALFKATGSVTAVCDRDSMIAVTGGGRKELLERFAALRSELRALPAEESAVPAGEEEAVTRILERCAGKKRAALRRIQGKYRFCWDHSHPCAQQLHRIQGK